MTLFLSPCNVVQSNIVVNLQIDENEFTFRDGWILGNVYGDGVGGDGHASCAIEGGEDCGGSDRERRPLPVPVGEGRGEDESGHSRVAETDAAVAVCGGRRQRCHLRRRAAGVLRHVVWSVPQSDARMVDEATYRRHVGGSPAMRRRDAHYFREKLRMSPRVFREITEALSPFLERRITCYREPLQPDQIVAYALYRWASGETYESGTCNFGIGRSSGLVAVRDVTAALLSAFLDKISWPTGLQKAVVLRAFADKGFPNCHGCSDCTHIFIDKPANCPGEDYYDRKRRFSVQAQVIVDLNLRLLDVFISYPGSCHDVRIVHLFSLWACAEAEELFTGPPVMLPFGVRTDGYLLGDNGYPPSEWVVVPYGGVSQNPVEMHFDNKQKTARGAVERVFGRLKGMWMLFFDPTRQTWRRCRSSSSPSAFSTTYSSTRASRSTTICSGRSGRMVFVAGWILGWIVP
ncbi:hypothetical protein CBR_g31855 [Chara braunii]|uniref:DDE Tnp4 domain-containing protein n=1 Tax=Chara braunii TaxID=69332 RepID=A0A388LFV1_CHABU|nr:hypothetical protein CBR_g31855 [Chara braunii]|eukprot:GBG81179.1 hypothetical protein CBR_g31855 [Chara braunii]